MDKLEKKQEQMCRALLMLNDAIDQFARIAQLESSPIDFVEHEDLYRTYRNSLVHCFEISVDLFWKYIKRKTESVSEKAIEFNAPAPTIRTAFSIGILSEDEAAMALQMIKDRNMTSNIYKEEIAEHLVGKIPGYYKVMQAVVER